MTQALSRGIYAPVATFFKAAPDQELDIETFVSNIKWLADTGLAGIVILGSTGEHVTLTRDERQVLTRSARAALSTGDYRSISNITDTVLDLLLIVGLAPQSLREAVELAKDAAEEGADFILCLPPHYWANAMNGTALINFYTELAEASPIPVIIYSYPSVTSGLDINSDDLSILASHPNIHGVKQTDHNCGKLARLGSFNPAFKPSASNPWMTMAGATDYLLGAHVLGAGGAISGMANLTPRACSKIWELAEQGKYAEAQGLQGIISWAEWVCARAGLQGVKSALTYYRGLDRSASYPRAPVPVISEGEEEWVITRLQQAVELEISLQNIANGPGLCFPALPKGSVIPTNGGNTRPNGAGPTTAEW